MSCNSIGRVLKYTVTPYCVTKYEAHGWLITVCRNEMMNILTSVMTEQKNIWFGNKK